MRVFNKIISLTVALLILTGSTIAIPVNGSADNGLPDVTLDGISTTIGSIHDAALPISFTLVNNTGADINYISFSFGADWGAVSCGDGISNNVLCVWGGTQQPNFVLHHGETLHQTATFDLTNAGSANYNVGFYATNTLAGWPTLETQNFDFTISDFPTSTATPQGWGFCVYTDRAPNTGAQQYYWKTDTVYNGVQFEFLASSGATFDEWLNGGSIPYIQSIDSDSSGTAYIINGATGSRVPPADSIETGVLQTGPYSGSFTMSNPTGGPVYFLWTDGMTSWWSVAPVVGNDCDTGVTPAATAPSITSPNSYTLGVRQAPAFTVTTTGSPTASITETGSLPQGLGFVDNGNGTASFIGLPEAGTSGSYTITITAINSAGSVSQTFTLTVSNVQSSPNSITSTTGSDTITLTEGTRMTPIVFMASGNKAPKVYVSAGSLPSGLSLHNNNDGTASLFGTPNELGTFTFTLTASNKSGTYSKTYTLVIN
ncbi:MAG: putative Ig domain-containing protein [Patescibacteria group bacterium]